MDEEDLWTLASHSSIALVEASLALAEQRAGHEKPNLVGLAATLMTRHIILDRPTPKQSKFIPGGLEAYLKRLEKLISPKTTQNAPFGHSQSTSRRFPSLHELCRKDNESKIEKRQPLRRALKSFANSAQEVIKLILQSLETLGRSGGDGAEITLSNDQTQMSKTFAMPDEYPSHVNRRFHAFLNQPSFWNCSALHIHQGRLRLREGILVQDEDVLFDTAFSAQPGDDNIRWQQLRFFVSSKIRQKPVVTFAPEEDQTGSASISLDHQVGEHHEIVRPTDFCNVLTENLGPVRLRLKLHENRLVRFLTPDDHIDQDLAGRSSISLLEYLKLHRLSSNETLILAYILARSVWQFYDSEWMQVGWTLNRIHFMIEEPEYDSGSKDRTVNLSIPYFGFQFGDESEEIGKEVVGDKYVVHKYPRVLALGTLLIEICRTSPDYEERIYENIAHAINTYCSHGHQVRENSDWPKLGLHQVLTKRFKDAVMACFEQAIFETPQSPNMDHQGTGIEERRAILYERVVWPLGQLLIDARLADETGRIHRIAARALQERADVNITQQPQFLGIQPEGHQSMQWLHKIASSSCTGDGIRWFVRNITIERIRIAVLDTGYDKQAEFFNDRDSRLKVWMDYVKKDNRVPIDQDGHGTHVLSLLMRMAPAADIFVARIAKNTEGLTDAVEDVAKAITWATKDCEADIVTMSFGYPEEVGSISNSILDAMIRRNRKVLFFGAAANLGGSQKEMFPASHEHVLSIRAADHLGAYQDFNPPMEFLGRKKYMTLGKDMPSPYQDGKCLSGTSFATPIAAGIVATMLADARSMAELKEGEQEALERLWTLSGMRSMLELITREQRMKDNCYFFDPYWFMAQDKNMRKACMVAAGFLS